jgi:hypothetical protein
MCVKWPHERPHKILAGRKPVSARLNNNDNGLATRNLGPFGLFPFFILMHRGGCQEAKEEQMNTKRLILAGCSIVILSVSSAMAGPCNTGDRAANLRDAGSGPASAGSGQTTGMASDSTQHPPTGRMNRAADDVAASSQDTQKQMQGEPTAAQQAQGAKPEGKTADQGC